MDLQNANNFGEALRNTRVSLNLSLREASKGLGYSKTTLGRIERNEKAISDLELSIIQSYYNTYRVLKANYDRTVLKYYTLRRLVKGKHFVINTDRELAFLYALSRVYFYKEGPHTWYTVLARLLRSAPLYFYMGTKGIVFSAKEPKDSELCKYSDLAELVEVLLGETIEPSAPVVTNNTSVEESSTRDLRIKAKLSIREVAKAVGLPQSSYSYMERGLRKFSEGKEQQAREYIESVLAKMDELPNLNNTVETTKESPTP